MRLTDDKIDNSITNFAEFDKHEKILPFEDKNTGLKGFIAIHNTNLGPAAGGTRYWTYASEEAALHDVLNLSRAMTYKCAMSGVQYGGGKGVIIADPGHKKTEDLLKEYAKQVNLLNGKFYTGEDVGIGEQDVRILAKYSNFIIGRPGIGGDPSPWAALGVFYAIQASLQFVFGSDEIKGRTFAIKGVGKVGSTLCHLLSQNGGIVTIADLDPQAVKTIRASIPNVKVAAPSTIHTLPADVYCPCALGNEFTEQTVLELRCKIVCGGANNQLASQEVGDLLFKRGITYIPDYLANAGGLINVVAELDQGGYSKEHVTERVKQIRVTAKAVLEDAHKNNESTSRVTDYLAQDIFLKKAPLH